MKTLGFWAGALWELLTGAPWRDLAGAVVLAVATASVYAAMLVWVP